MPSRNSDYEPLLADADGDHELDKFAGQGAYPPSGPSSPPPRYASPTPSPLTLRALLNTPRLFFVFSCCVALVLSALNYSVLSAADAFNAYTAERAPKRRPSVYTGLETLKWDENRCRRRTTYPTEYATIERNDVAGRKVVHGYRDEVDFAFGGDVSVFG
jgi:hypothetical protein